MTNKQILDYYIFEAKDGYAREAIEVLAATNKISEEEIVEILREQGMTVSYRKDKTMMTAEIRAAIIKDYNEGMDYKEIAERYQLNAHTVYNNILNWSKKGWVELRPSKTEKPVHKPRESEKAVTEVMTEEQPESKTEQVIKLFEGKDEGTSADKPDEATEQNIRFDTALDILHALTVFARLVIKEAACKEFEITGVYACNESGTSEVELTVDATRYILQMKKAEE